jgi:hypothetical protein
MPMSGQPTTSNIEKQKERILNLTLSAAASKVMYMYENEKLEFYSA